MELFQERLTSTLISWLLVAVIGIAISALTYLLLLKNLHIQERMRNPIQEIISMLQHNMLAEVIRGTAQICGIMLGVGYLVNLLPVQAVGWALVLMNVFTVVGSLNEFFTALRILKEDDETD